ncbi:MAG: PAS domain S-box protein, partial [Candidatus Thermoplasmatota archaeon]|nr:PAS domain S-box protein [Candidatus Thermoplasmatota archaeon]
LTPSSSAGYGEVYFLSSELEQNYEIFRSIASKLKHIASSHAFFQNVIEQTHDAVMIIDEEEQVLFWNRSAERLLGYSDKEILGKTIPIFNDPKFIKLAIKDVADKNEARVQEIIGRDKSGRPVDLEINIGGIADEERNIIAYSILARDIGVRKRNEERLRYLNVLLTAINDVNQLINRVSDIDTLIQKAADRLNDTQLFIDVSIGLQRDPDSNGIILVGHCGVHGTESWRITPEGSGEGPNCVKSAAKSMKTAIVNGIGEECAGCHRNCGHEGYSSVTIPMKYRGGLIGIFSVCFSPGHVIYKEEISLLEEVVRDLTLARVKMLAEDILAESKDRFSSALFAARSGAWDWNLKTGELAWSDGLERIFGFGQGEIKLTHDALLDCVHIEDRHKVADATDACLKGKKEYDAEYRVVWSDGSIHWIREAGDILLDQNNEPSRMLAVVSDISKRKVLESELREALDKAQTRQIGAVDC